MKKITQLCDGYKHLDDDEGLGAYLKKYYNKQEDPIRLAATPWKMVHEEQSDIAILCCHGYTGYPGELCYVGLELYNAGFDVFTPRYMGHGGSRRDFLNTNSEDWLTIARESAKYLLEKYKKLYVVGHSMGGAISIIIAKEFNVDKLVSIAPATDIIGFNKLLIYGTNPFIEKLEKPWKSDSAFFGICERNVEDDEYLGHELWKYHFPKQLIELDKIRKLSLKCIKDLRADTLCLIGEDDTLIKLNAAKRLKNKPLGNNDGIIIKNAGHLLPYSKNVEAREECLKRTVEWFL